MVFTCPQTANNSGDLPLLCVQHIHRSLIEQWLLQNVSLSEVITHSVPADIRFLFCPAVSHSSVCNLRGTVPSPQPHKDP
jgi:hypothetical protein